jgi:hypothetical protein
MSAVVDGPTPTSTVPREHDVVTDRKVDRRPAGELGSESGADDQKTRGVRGGVDIECSRGAKGPHRQDPELAAEAFCERGYVVVARSVRATKSGDDGAIRSPISGAARDLKVWNRERIQHEL